MKIKGFVIYAFLKGKKTESYGKSDFNPANKFEKEE